ncbi:MAG: hypothetical protein RMX65_030690 [Nostoc sp. DedQUE01]
MVVKLLIRCLPDSIVDTINAESLAELNRRQLIIWAEDVPVVEPENKHSAYHLAARFQQVTPENLPEVLKAMPSASRRASTPKSTPTTATV